MTKIDLKIILKEKNLKIYEVQQKLNFFRNYKSKKETLVKKYKLKLFFMKKELFILKLIKITFFDYLFL